MSSKNSRQNRSSKFFAWFAAMLLLCQPLGAFDTFWHSAATSAAGRQLGFTDDAINIVQFGNFSGPDYFGPLFDETNMLSEQLGIPQLEDLKVSLGMEDPAPRSTLQDFNKLRNGQPLHLAREYATFLHFDNLNGELNENWKFDYLFLKLLQNTKATIKSFHSRSDLSDRRKQMLILMTLGGSLHMVQDFYSHSNWVHQDFPGLGMPLVKMPWGKPRAPTWFEVRAKLGLPTGWPFHVMSGVYPPPSGNSPYTHSHMNHDNSQLWYDGKSQESYHEQGPVPTSSSSPNSIAEHQLFAVNTAAGASIEWIQKLEQDADVRAAIDFSRVIKLQKNDPMIPQLTSALGSTLFLSCAAGKWDGWHGPTKRHTECHGIFMSLATTTGPAGAAIPPLMGTVGPGGMGPTPSNEFWAMHIKFNLVMDLAGGFGTQGGGDHGHYNFDKSWYQSVASH